MPGTLNFLSIASNRKLKAPAFKLVGSFVKKVKRLQFLDVSQNTMDKKSVEYIGAALSPANEPGLISLRMDDCSLRPTSLESLGSLNHSIDIIILAYLNIVAQAVRTSSLRNISLRHNRISASGAVALALMIKDYPDAMPASAVPSSSSSIPSSASSLFSTLSPPSTPTTASPPVTPTLQSIALPSDTNVAPPSPRLGVLPPPTRQPLLPPPTHPANLPLQTTYTPYIPRRRAVGATATMKAVQNATLSPNPLSASGQPVPVITSSAQGGVTMRHPVQTVSLAPLSPAPGGTGGMPNAQRDHTHGPSAALLDKVRALDALPRLGELRTLDLRGNDIKVRLRLILD